MDTVEARRRLEQELAALGEIGEELDREADRSTGQEPTSARQHPADEATGAEIDEQRDAYQTSLGDRRGQIEAALRHIDEGTYGTCVSCGRPIPDERLEARPEADRCLPCQRQSEQADAGFR